MKKSKWIMLPAMVSFLLSASTFAQNPIPPSNKEAMNRSYNHFDKVLGEAGWLVDEAKKKRRTKDYAAAEALCAQAMKVLKDGGATPFQDIVKGELGEIDLAKGDYDQALDLWLPYYNPKGGDVALDCGIAIAYARTDRALKGAKILVGLYNAYKVVLGGSINLHALPMWDDVTPDTVEATSLMLEAHLQNVDAAETTDRLKRAYALDPSNAVANYLIGLDYSENHALSFVKILSYYAKAYHNGDADLQNAVGLILRSNNYSLSALAKY